jgi:hypothetical protein
MTMVTIPHPRRHSQRAIRHVVFVAISLAMHLTFALSMALLAGSTWFPRIEVTWLDVDNILGAPQPTKRPSRPKPALEKKKKPAPERKAPPRPRPKPSPKLASVSIVPDAGVAPVADAALPGTDAGAPSAPELADLAPGDAALMLLLRMDRVHKSPYENEVRRLLQVFYDHKTLLWSSGLDPVQDFSTMLIATPNPYRITQTFLVAQHQIPLARVRRALQRSASFKRQRLRWQRQGPDLKGLIPSPPRLPHDRRVVLLQQNLVMLTDPKYTTMLREQLAKSETSTDAGAPRSTWIQRLDRMSHVGGSDQEGPGLILRAVNLSRMVRLPADIPLPLSITGTMAAVEPTEAKAELLFADASIAQKFLKAIPHRIKKAKQSLLLRLLGVTDLLESIQFKETEEKVVARIELSGDQVRGLLELLRSMIPQVNVPGMPPRLAPDAGVTEASPDAGVLKPSPDAGPTRDSRK